MKNSFLFTLALSVASLSNSFAQISLDSSDFAGIGDTFTLVNVANPDTITVLGGANSTWDFSMLKADTLLGVKVRKVDSNTHPQDSTFPNAEMHMRTPSYGDAYLIKTADSLMLDGMANLEFVQGTGIDYDFDPNLKLMHFPMNYLDSFITTTQIDSSLDTNIPIFNFDSLRILVTIEVKTVVEGWGTLITPQGSKSALKIYSRQSQDLKAYGHHPTAGWSSAPFFTDSDITHAYRWFAKGMDYQIVEAIADERNGKVLSANFVLLDSLFAYFSKEKDPNCYGSSDGELTVKAVGGVGTYTYNWSHNGSNQTSAATNLSAGTYSVTVTDPISSKTFVASSTLIDPDSIGIYLVSKKDEGPAPKTGEIEIGVTGGKSPYTYAWDKSLSTTKIASDLEGGTHKITVTDAANCNKDTSITIGSTVGMGEIEKNHNLIVSPNPFSKNIKLTSEAAIHTVQVIGISGKLEIVKEYEGVHFIDLDLSQLQTGNYILEVRTVDSEIIRYQILKN